MLNNGSMSYGFVAKLFHWLVAVAVVGLFALGVWMVELSYYDEWNKLGPHYHKSIGVLLAIVMVLRIVWRLAQRAPLAPSSHSMLEKRLARYAHMSLYILTVSIIISGYLISTADGRGIDVLGLFKVLSMGAFVENQEDIAGDIHRWLGYGLIVVASLHALAALKHHFFDKDDTLRRMLL